MGITFPPSSAHQVWDPCKGTAIQKPECCPQAALLTLLGLSVHLAQVWNCLLVLVYTGHSGRMETDNWMTWTNLFIWCVQGRSEAVEERRGGWDEVFSSNHFRYRNGLVWKNCFGPDPLNSLLSLILEVMAMGHCVCSCTEDSCRCHVQPRIS